MSDRGSILSTGSNGFMPTISLQDGRDVTEYEFPCFEGYEIWSAEYAKKTLRVTFQNSD